MFGILEVFLGTWRTFWKILDNLPHTCHTGRNEVSSFVTGFVAMVTGFVTPGRVKWQGGLATVEIKRHGIELQIESGAGAIPARYNPTRLQAIRVMSR